MLHINRFHIFSRLCQRNTLSAADKQRHFIQSDLHIMMPLPQYFLTDRAVRQEFDELHLFRQINIAPLRILRVDRSDHDLIPQHHLIFHLQRHRIFRINESQRFKIQVVI